MSGNLPGGCVEEHKVNVYVHGYMFVVMETRIEGILEAGKISGHEFEGVTAILTGAVELFERSADLYQVALAVKLNDPLDLGISEARRIEVHRVLRGYGQTMKLLESKFTSLNPNCMKKLKDLQNFFTIARQVADSQASSGCDGSSMDELF